jgi:molybdate transport system permease protein
VSLALALATDPRVVFLDEPFSGLDAPVRADLRRELRRLQRDVNLSTVLVTHDPEEAAMLADQIVVLRDGAILQSGSCREVYQRPASVEVGRLLGVENLFEGVAGAGGVLSVGGWDVTLPPALTADLSPGARLLWHVPPDAVQINLVTSNSPPGASGLDLGRGQVVDIVELGRAVEIVLALEPGIELRARTADLPNFSIGDSCRAQADAETISMWAHGSITDGHPGL